MCDVFICTHTCLFAPVEARVARLGGGPEAVADRGHDVRGGEALDDEEARLFVLRRGGGSAASPARDDKARNFHACTHTPNTYRPLLGDGRVARVARRHKRPVGPSPPTTTTTTTIPPPAAIARVGAAPFLLVLRLVLRGAATSALVRLRLGLLLLFRRLGRGRGRGQRRGRLRFRRLRLSPCVLLRLPLAARGRRRLGRGLCALC